MSFEKIFYKGKEVKIDGITGTMRIVVGKKSNPDELDMRYRTNKQFVKELKANHETNK